VQCSTCGIHAQVCEEYNHWAELVFLYVQYDEYDNAALIMIAHSPTAWEHTHFKDVLVKVQDREWL
jgi:clathrin heavy chain